MRMVRELTDSDRGGDVGTPGFAIPEEAHDLINSLKSQYKRISPETRKTIEAVGSRAVIGNPTGEAISAVGEWWREDEEGEGVQ